MPADVMHASSVTLFQLNTQTQGYEPRGTVGAAVTGENGVYKLLCYDNNQEYLATATLTGSNDSLKMQLKQGNYLGFRDDSGQQFSLYFNEEQNMHTFAMHIALAMYGAAGMPTHTLMHVDLTDTSGSATVDVSDTVGLKFNGYYVGASATGVPNLSYQYDSNTQSKHTYKIQIPSSNTNLTADMKGFEGAVCGMSQGGQRIVIVPHNCRRGTDLAGESTIIVLVEVKKVKKEENPQTHQAQPQQGYSSPPMQQQQPQAGNFQDYQRLQQQASPTALIGMQGQMQPVAAQPVQQQQMFLAPADALQAAPVAAAPAAVPVAAAPKEAAAAAGLTPEQLRTMNDTATNVTSMVSNLNDLSQKVDLLSNDFKVAQKQAKPTTLTAAQLTHSVTAMLDENKQLKDEVRAKDDMIKTLENRSLELEKKVDKFANSAHSLMSEKKSAASSASDMRLEMDRRVLKLQEEVTRANSERDDSQRHLATVKKLLDLSEDEIRKVKGENEIVKVQSESTRMKLTHTEDSFRTEKEARKLSDDKVMQLSAELSETRDNLMRREKELQEKMRKIEADRLHFNNLIEEERQRAERELAAMRDEMLTDLQSREKRFVAEKERVAEDQFERGTEKGKEEGTTEARLMYEDIMSGMRASAMETEGNLKDDVSKLEVDVSGLQTELAGERSTVASLKEELSSLQDKHTCLEHEHTLLGESAEREQAKHAEFETEQEDVRSKLEVRIDELNDKVERVVQESLDAGNEAAEHEEKFRNAQLRLDAAVAALKRDVVPTACLATLCGEVFRGQQPDLSFEEDDSHYPAPVVKEVRVPVEKTATDDDWSDVTRPSDAASAEAKKAGPLSSSSDEKAKAEDDADLVKVEKPTEAEEEAEAEAEVEKEVEKEEEEEEEKAAVEEVKKALPDSSDDESDDEAAAAAEAAKEKEAAEAAAAEAEAAAAAEAAAKEAEAEEAAREEAEAAEKEAEAAQEAREKAEAEEAARAEAEAAAAAKAEAEAEEARKAAEAKAAAEEEEEEEAKAVVEEKKEEEKEEEEEEEEKKDVPAPPVAAPVAKVPVDSDSDDEPIRKPPAPAPTRTTFFDSDSDSESTDPRPRKPAVKKAVPKPAAKKTLFESSSDESD